MFDCRELKQRAKVSLARTPCDPKRLVLIHVGASTVASLLLTTITYFLQVKIETTGGLSGIGLRSVLSTALAVLRLFYIALLPFWQIGYLSVSLSVARCEPADKETLYTGFYRFWSVLRLYFFQTVILGALFLGSNYVSSFLYMLTPWGKSLSEQLMVVMEQSGEAISPDVLLEVFSGHTAPLLILGGLILLSLAIPVFYRIRLCRYRVMDDQPRSIRAIFESVRLTKGNWRSLVKLDLSFWWFYVIQIAIAAVAYADVLLELAGYPLPWHPAVRFFVPYLCSLLLQFIFLLWQKNPVAVTYAHAYEAMRQAKEDKPESAAKPNQAPPPKSVSKKHPWEDTYQRSSNQ
ncbi:MAG: hypothetical protein IJB91_02080 [Oscillospiraceae bacterium]|nr:hypothetical protein [Oscillospiraceae bacterium]